MRLRADIDVDDCVQFGVFVMTTSAGIMDHEEARRKKVGGKVRLKPSAVFRAPGCAANVSLVSSVAANGATEVLSATKSVKERNPELPHSRAAFELAVMSRVQACEASRTIVRDPGSCRTALTGDVLRADPGFLLLSEPTGAAKTRAPPDRCQIDVASSRSKGSTRCSLGL